MENNNNNQDKPDFTKYDLFAQLDEKGKLILKAVIENPNMTNIKLSKALDMDRHIISNYRKLPAFKKALDNFRRTALQVLLDSQTMAARRLVTLSNSTDEAVAVRACKEILKGVLTENIKLNDLMIKVLYE